MSDPNQWVTNPPSTFVIIQNTSQTALNGQKALIVQFQNGRYVAVLTKTPQLEPKSFQPQHLVKATYLQQMQAQYEILTNSPETQRQIQQALSRVKQSTGLDAQYVVIIMAVALIASLWFLGFSRTLMLTSFSIMVAMVLLPAYLESSSLKAALQRAPDRMRMILRESQLPMAQTIASSNMYMGLLVALLVGFFVTGMLPKSIATSAATWAKSHSQQVTTSLADIERYYTLGFEDASEQKPFGTSLPKEESSIISTSTVKPHRAPLDAVDHEFSTANGDYDYSNIIAPPPTSSKISSLFNISNFMSAGVIFRTVNELGRSPVSGAFDIQLFMANLRSQPTWRLGLLGVSVYRLVSAIIKTMST